MMYDFIEYFPKADYAHKWLFSFILENQKIHKTKVSIHFHQLKKDYNMTFRTFNLINYSFPHTRPLCHQTSCLQVAGIRQSCVQFFIKIKIFNCNIYCITINKLLIFLLQKRRSARNTQRKKYVDDIMLTMSDDESSKSSPKLDVLKQHSPDSTDGPVVKPNFVYIVSICKVVP